MTILEKDFCHGIGTSDGPAIDGARQSGRLVTKVDILTPHLEEVFIKMNEAIQKDAT
jgi:hypothetical protein